MIFPPSLTDSHTVFVQPAHSPRVTTSKATPGKHLWQSFRLSASPWWLVYSKVKNAAEEVSTSSVLGGGMVMALKPVPATQVRRPERSQVPGREVCFAYPEKNWPSDITETGPGWAKAAREQTSVAQSIILLYKFNSFWLYLSNLFFIFFGRSGPVRELVPLYRSPRPWLWRTQPNQE